MADRPGPPLLDEATIAGLLPAPQPRAHKGSRGRVLVVAGSLDYLGAALLAASAATRGGAGLVTLCVPASLQPLVAGRIPEITTFALPEAGTGVVDPSAAAERIGGTSHDALVVGPGLAAGDATRELVEALVTARAEGGDQEPPPAVLDAEALNCLAGLPDWWQRSARRCVLTPHPGEFARLATGAGWAEERRDLSGDDEARAAVAARAAAEWRQVVVLKGANTVIADPAGAVHAAPFENPALATAGSGDVLAGLIGALLGAGCAPSDAARAGVYVHGSAGEAARERFGDSGVVASDLPEEVALSMRRLRLLADRLAPGRRLGFTMDGGA